MGSARELTGPINLGNPEEFTIKELAETVAELTGCKAGFTYLPLPHDDPVRRRPDISLAKRHLGWQPTVKLREGLKRTIDYFDRQLSAGPAAPSVRAPHEVRAAEG
jgi:UDP-glucuronate decarboxylase